MNPFRPFVFGLLLGGAAILATILAAQLEDDDEAPSLDGVQAPAPVGLADVFPAGFVVAAVTLRGGILGPSRLPLDIRRPADAQVIQRLRSWVVAASATRQPVELTSGAQGYPLFLEFFARDGSEITLSPAADCQSGRRSTTCSMLPNSLDVYRRRDPVRLYSPELAAWLRDGWQRDMRTGTADDFEREWAAIGIKAR